MRCSSPVPVPLSSRGQPDPTVRLPALVRDRLNRLIGCSQATAVGCSWPGEGKDRGKPRLLSRPSLQPASSQRKQGERGDKEDCRINGKSGAVVARSALQVTEAEGNKEAAESARRSHDSGDDSHPRGEAQRHKLED